MPRPRRRLIPAAIMLLVAFWMPLIMPVAVWADRLGDRGVQLQNSFPGATTTYKFFVTLTTASTVGSLRILLCSNSPLIDDSCTIPTGLDVTHEQIQASSGFSAFNVFPEATNQLLVSWGPVTVTPPLDLSLTLSNITNPSDPGPYYGRYTTYASTNGSGPVVDYGGLAFAITANLQISSYVPPYLTFCSGLVIPTFNCDSASGAYINFGNLSSSRSSQGSSQFLVATNAAGGYTVQIYGTTMAAGNNVINALSSNAGSRPGSSQFGLNLRANSVPPVGADPTGPGSGQPAPGYDLPNSYRFVSNDVVASSSNADNWRKYTVSYIVNVPVNQPPGIYASTVTYVSAGSF